MSALAKTINLLLYDGTLQGVISIEDSGWNAGAMYISARDTVDSLIATEACKRFGVYLLLANNRVYVGQSSDLARRLNEHLDGKDWWDSALVLTTSNDSFDHTDIDYLESQLIARATSIDGLNCDNRNRGNPPKVNKFREVLLGQYLDEALFLMELIGISVFSNAARLASSGRQRSAIPRLDAMTIQDRLALGMRNKNDAIEYMRDYGLEIGNNVNFATYREGRQGFWINPKTTALQQDWQLILNDTRERTLILLKIPVGSLTLRRNDPLGLLTRSDKPELIDLMIDRDTLTDRKTGLDFSHYIIARLSY